MVVKKKPILRGQKEESGERLQEAQHQRANRVRELLLLCFIIVTEAQESPLVTLKEKIFSLF